MKEILEAGLDPTIHGVIIIVSAIEVNQGIGVTWKDKGTANVVKAIDSLTDTHTYAIKS